MRISRLDAPRCRGGENPLWDDRLRLLHYLDNSGMKLHSHDPASGASRTLDLPEIITTLVLRESGGAVVTLRSGIYFLDLENGALDLIHALPEPRPYGFNDGKADCRGRFIIGASTTDHRNPGPDGGLFRLDPDLRLVQLDGGIHYSNGPAWSPDNRTFYFSDSWLKTTYAYDYDADTGEVSNRRAFADSSALGGVPDGAAVDCDGRYWVAIYRAGKIAAYRPDGALDRLIDMPVPLVSSVTFGGPALDRLFVTSIAHDITAPGSAEAAPAAGSLFVVDGLGVSGVPANRFGG